MNLGTFSDYHRIDWNNTAGYRSIFVMGGYWTWQDWAGIGHGSGGGTENSTGVFVSYHLWGESIIYGSLNYQREELVHRFIICTDTVEIVISLCLSRVVLRFQILMVDNLVFFTFM